MAGFDPERPFASAPGDHRVDQEAVIRARLLAALTAHANSSSSAFASFKSGVSKPSVNQS